MKPTLFFFLFSFSFFTVFLQADESLVPQSKLSPSGVRRLRENKQILLESLETTEKNIKHSLANQETIENQISEIERIENELHKLKIQYESFISSANKELDVNQQELKKLGSLSGKASKTGEVKERKDWAQTTRNKVTEVTSLLKKLEKDSKGMKVRKADLEKQKRDWYQREKAHQALLNELKAKKQSLEDQLKGDS